MPLELVQPLAVACHDAGAANIVLAWLEALELPCRAWMQGPAAKLWNDKFEGVPLAASLHEALDGAATLLSGTGWASTLEHAARLEARQRGVHSIAVIDHWVNYLQRFEREGETVWPDEFWVTDEYAYAEAQRCFPGRTVRLQPNLYLERQLQGIRTATLAIEPGEVLYVLEPARSRWGRDTEGEFQALDHFMSHRMLLGLPGDSRVALRPHPSDPPHKYDAWIDRQQGRARLDSSASLDEAIARHAWVAGTESFALVVALLAGRRVVCTLPPWAPACRLPHGGLIHLKDLV